MIVFAKADGTIIDVMPSPVFQGSNMSGSIFFVAPLASLNAVTVAFKLPNGILTEPYRMTLVSELDGVTDKLGEEYSVWEWQDGNAEITEYAGVCVAQFSVYLPNGKLLTTSRTSFNVEEGVPPIMPDEPTEDVYKLILRYLAQLDSRTKNVPNSVASIQKVASNAFIYTNNSGAVLGPIVLTVDEDAPIPVNTASKVVIPDTAWQAEYSGVDITGYTYTLTAAMHGQIRDGAMPNDLWVSFDETDGVDLLGAFKRYTIDSEGNIRVYVNQPVTLTVRVWNGKSISDSTVRELITAETERAETAEEELQRQITELQNTGVDETARKNIEDLSNTVTELAAQVSGLIKVVPFTDGGWAATDNELYYLGALNKTIEVPSGSRIVQILDNNNMPRGTWRNNVIYANEAFAGVAIII